MITDGTNIERGFNQAAMSKHEHPIGDLYNFVEIAGMKDDCTPSCSGTREMLMYRGRGFDIQAARGILGYKGGRFSVKLPAHKEVLLIATGNVYDTQLD